MIRMAQALAMAGIGAAGLALTSCAPAPDAQAAAADRAPLHARYLGIQTLLLDSDIVNFRVAMTGARDETDVEAYARCAAAQYALIRGYGFARHLRTRVEKVGGEWRGDAAYTISAALPRGLMTIDAEVTVRDCGDQGIPTV